jgi:putative transcriptional regulator
MQEKKTLSLKKARFYFLAAAILIGVPNFFGLYNGQTGHLLVATNKASNDPNFSQRVIYIYYNGVWGAHGIVINEPLSNDIAEEKSSLEEQNSYALFKGGPVAFPESKIVALNVPSKASRWKTQPLTVVDFNSYKSYLDQSNADASPDNDQKEEKGHKPLYFGFAGWVTGQLESELRRGMWRVLECDNLDFNGVNSSDLWQHLSGDLQTTSCTSKN